MSGGIVGVATPDPGTSQLINRLANPPNPLEQVGQSINALTSLRQYQAQQASADAYRQSVDPNTGEVDLGKYKALLSQGPGAFNFGPLVTSGGQAVGAVGEGTSANVKANTDQLTATSRLLFPLLRDGADTQSIDPARVQAQLDQAYAMNLVTPQNYAAWSGKLKNMTPQDAYGFVLGANMGNETARGMMTPNMFGTGGAAININPFSPGGRTVPPGGLTYTPSPGEQINYQTWLKTPYSWYDPKTLQYTQGTYEQFLNARGANPTLQWAGPPPPQQQPQGAPGEPSGKIEAPPAPAASGGGVPGAAPAPAAPPAAGGAPTRAPAPSAGGAPAPAAPAPGAAGSPATLPPPKTIESSTDAYNTAQADQADSAARVATMQRALAAAKGAPIGPGTEGINTIRGIVGNFTPDFLQRVMPGDTSYEKSTDYQVLHKYLQGIANANTAAFGGSATNDKLAATVAANPNTNMNTASVDEVLKVMIAGEHANQYIWKAAENQNIAPAAFGKFRADWMNTHDIRAFAVNDLDPKARQQLYAETHNAQGKLNAAGTKFNNTIHELQTNNSLPEASSPEPEPGQD